ncbi:MAG: hypothetical protein B6I36_10950 [Desulfobacteraceae bacterium 4572_35.1]|nr:MAG: hypothetical protein B6I36_10950 [Desulfobacteraceae bacterium 4572_35.1]
MVIKTIIGRVGSSVLLFQVEAEAAIPVPPYKVQGDVYSLNNLLCFCQTAPRILRNTQKNQQSKLTQLVEQANLKLEIADSLLMPSIFKVVANECFKNTETLVGIVEKGKWTSKKKSDTENIFRVAGVVKSKSCECCIGNGSIKYSENSLQFKYALHNGPDGINECIESSRECFNELFPLVETYLQL